MLFNSAEFFIFFIVVVLLYYAMQRRFRWQNVLLLLASYIFYGWWDVRFLHLIVVSTVVDYCIGLLLENGRMQRKQVASGILLFLSSSLLFVVVPWSDTGITIDTTSLGEVGHAILNSSRWGLFGLAVAVVCVGGIGLVVLSRMEVSVRRKALLMISVLCNLGILAFFKYCNFFAENLILLCQQLSLPAPDKWTLNIILPVGISFYTFQTMSYTIDVYRRKLAPSDDLVEFATYVAFFPQLVAGPIERAEHLLPQFRNARPALNFAVIREGTWLLFWGLYKKVVVADRMALIANRFFEPYDSHQAIGGQVDGMLAWIAVIAFAFQIYGDFSGYTDIARGTAKLLGFDLMLNFRLPYFALTPSEFWRRWHISLSTWLRDYLYISLGGNKHGVWNTYRNLILTMLLGGLWHGASWNFVIWGAFHGILLCLYRAFGIDQFIAHRRSWTWNALVFWPLMFVLTLIGWLIFRAQDVSTIATVLRGMFANLHWTQMAKQDGSRLLFFSWFLVLFQVAQFYTGDLQFIRRMHWFLRLNVYIFVVMSIASFAVDTTQSFIYFAF